ncbi:putative helicase mov-10-B.1 [Penaeus japonicus]|uniref:putative helicase mov-10-B.1 n=1 Tax=Penaeus japonicus TaxID=27405 RepID=UPI001C715417|nr:putative helicase mov-10-B.1 [Penaeus japonicus]XP_042873603.1 putative helicase mov-10-B.1 [Penaeus japonicus]XP_042873604.1 putative helicase mov-10-B.1 [Penaeus japonicus]
MVFPAASNIPNYHCPLCQEVFDSSAAFEEHKATAQHRVRWLKHWYQNNRLLLARNKNGIVVWPQANLDNITFEERSGTVSIILSPGSQKTFPLIVKNTGNCPAILRQIELLHACSLVKITDNYGVSQGERYVRVLPDVEYAVECHVEAGILGVEQVPVAFQFRLEDSSQPFFIIRTIQVNVVDSIAQESAATKPFERQNAGFKFRRDPGSYIPGVPVDDDKKVQKTKRLPLKQFFYNRTLHTVAVKNFNPKKVAPQHQKMTKDIKAMLKDGLNANNYVDWFQTLLWLEEMQMEIDISYYNMTEVPLRRVSQRQYSKADCVELEVPGLAENRPSILRRDNVFVTLPGLKPVYEGCVHQVNEKSIYLAFSAQFMSFFVDKMKVNVEFTFSRYPLRVCHRAITLTKMLSLRNLTFPNIPASSTASIQNILPFNRKLESNAEQMEAVRNIVAGTSKPAPYIVFGPPGTGKTVTIVEAIKQIYKLQPNSRIVACAPSNSAADIISVRLLEHISKQHMLRMHAESRNILTIPEKLRDMSNIQDGNIYTPVDEKLMAYRIIVCTLVTAGKIAGASLPHGHITHVFLDECGHAMEPEAMSALAGIIEKDSQVVLTGDPHQLGPVIRNTQCFSGDESLFQKNGLDKSYLERLMEMPMYKDSTGHYNRQVVTKLLNNYRSHASILKEPNEMFYDSELKVCADPVYVTAFCKWEYLPKKGFPVIFHGVKGKDEREGNSPSFFNALEVSTVIDYVKKLFASRNPKVLGREIGVITPYRRQVEKIRTQLKKVNGAKEIKVGSPEEFQGDERRVIIISTVRASADQLASDQLFRLGFLRNCKRFNVAVTRAKALLILVGCPEILALDDHWGKLMDYIHEMGGYCGQPFPQVTDNNLDDLLLRFSKLDLRPTLYEEVSAREKAEAPEWHTEY